MKIKVDNDLCIGCGACQAICPDVFEFNDEGMMQATDNDIDKENKDDVIDAIEGCPVSAIKEIDDK